MLLSRKIQRELLISVDGKGVQFIVAKIHLRCLSYLLFKGLYSYSFDCRVKADCESKAKTKNKERPHVRLNI